jgi:hypothetical protein
VDYLLKPVEPARVRETLDRAAERLEQTELRIAEAVRPARALFDAFQTDKFELLSGPDVEHALAAVPVAGKYHRVPFCDIQHSFGGKPASTSRESQCSSRSAACASLATQNSTMQTVKNSRRPFDASGFISSLKYHHSLSSAILNIVSNDWTFKETERHFCGDFL